MATETIRVLIIEDNPRDVEIVRRMLGEYKRVNFDLDAASSGRDGLQKLSSNVYDLVLLDYVLPDEDGLDILTSVKGDPDVPPVIMLSAHGDERVAVQAMTLGAYDYFPKSCITSEILGQAIHQVLEKYRLSEQLEGAEQVIFALAAAVEAKDATTEGHLHRMTSYAVQLGQALSLDEHQLLLLRYSALMHDIGKIGVSQAILSKPGPLTEGEWEEMRQHPIIGEAICAPLRFSHKVGPIIRHHHERWDGKGYVDSLSGDEIPFLARAISVVDAFDAMTTDRPYRKALPLDEAVRRLSEGAGTQWDPDITGVCLDLVRGGRLSPRAGQEEATKSGNGSRSVAEERQGQ